MGRRFALREGHLNALRSLAESGGRGAFLSNDHPIFCKAVRDVVALLIVLYDQNLIERVPKSDDGWFRITAAGLERIASQRKRALAKLVRRGQRSKPRSLVAIGGREKRKTPPKRGSLVRP